jgi:hypothetical protein
MTAQTTGGQWGRSMRRDKRLLVLLLVAVLITGSVLAVFVYSIVQANSAASFSVRTDRMIYNAGENVTFKLIVNTPGTDFNITDPSLGPFTYYHGRGVISIIKIPDYVSVDEAIEDLHVENLMMKRIQTYSSLATVTYGYFDSKM